MENQLTIQIGDWSLSDKICMFKKVKLIEHRFPSAIDRSKTVHYYLFINVLNVIERGLTIMGQRVGYARVSTAGQKLDVQLDALKGCDKLFQEKVSATSHKRPELEKMLSYVREGDVVVITKLDRLGRSVVDLCNIAKDLESRGVGLEVIDQRIDTTTSTGKLMFNMIAAVAEFELSLRYERQMDGIEKAKEQGVQFGRKKTINKEVVLSLRAQGLSMGAIAKELGISKGSVHKALSED